VVIVVTVLAVVAVAALPVVFWLSVGNVQLAKLPDAGVPKAGVTRVGLVDKTTSPVPVEVVTPVPPLATDSVPEVPAIIGKPVQLVKTPADGVPIFGVTRVGDAKSALVATAVAMLLNSMLISVPLTIFKGSPDDSASLVAKFVL
jgi:hypothetical protein